MITVVQAQYALDSLDAGTKCIIEGVRGFILGIALCMAWTRALYAP